MIMPRWPWPPPPRLDGTARALAKTSWISFVIMVLVGAPTMTVSFGWGKAKLVGVAMFEFRGGNTRAERQVLWRLFE